MRRIAQPREGVPLRLVGEQDRLDRMELGELVGAERPPASGALAVLLPAGGVADWAMRETLAARSGGPGRPDDPPLWRSGEAAVCRVGEAWHLPRFGAVIDEAGQVFRSTVSGAHSAEVLAAAPGISRDAAGALVFHPPGDAPRLPASTVFMAWGGGFNYGHFLIDCLAALMTVSAAGLLARFPPVAPPLKPWSRDLLRLAFGDLPVQEVAAGAVRLEQVAFSTSMDHFLHAPNGVILGVREHMLGRTPRAFSAPRRLYLSRRSPSHSMRVMINEAELEAELQARGFLIVRPEALPAAEQIILMRDAQVVVGASGAALANALFLPPGAKVFEIQPQNFASAWVPALCEMVGCDWFLYHPHSPAPERDTPWLRRVRRGFKFGFRVELADFLAFLDARI